MSFSSFFMWSKWKAFHYRLIFKHINSYKLFHLIYDHRIWSAICSDNNEGDRKNIIILYLCLHIKSIWCRRKMSFSSHRNIYHWTSNSVCIFFFISRAFRRYKMECYDHLYIILYLSILSLVQIKLHSFS